MDLTIGICTFRRDSIAETLRSIAGQQRVDKLPAVLVIDNDVDRQAEARICEAGRACGLDLTYVHAPQRNISIARNAAMANAKTRWLAFVDDDEIAQDDWLFHLWSAHDAVEAVIGPVLAIYTPQQPTWLAACDFHSARITGRLDNAYSGNALIDLEFVRLHGLTFDLSLGRTGGEDTVFFRTLTEAGGRMAYEPKAIVNEPVPDSRARMQWVIRRNFRAGQTHGLLMHRFDRQSNRWLALTAGAKALVSVGMAVLTAFSAARSRFWLARSCMHAGVVSYRLHNSIIDEY